MRINKCWTTLLAGACAAMASLSAAPFSSLISEDVGVYASIRSVAESRSEWEEHPLATVIEDPELQELFEPWIGVQPEAEDGESLTEVLANEFGLTWDELFELFPGQMALAWFQLPELMLEQVDRPEMVLMAEFAGEPEQLANLMQVQFERNAEKHREMNPEAEHILIEETFMGETLYFDEVFDGEETYIEDGYALVDGIFILATPEERLRSAVEAIKDEPGAALSENRAYVRSREEGGRGDLEIYVNLEAILPPLNTALIQNLMQSGAAMMGLNASSLNTMLSLESMQGLFFDLDLTRAGIESRAGILYREKLGLLKLLTYTDAPLPEARFVPSGVFSTTISNFDLGEMLAQFESLLTTASPNLRVLIDTQMQTIRSQTGVDLRSSVLENFGDDMVSLSILPEGAPEGTAILEPDQVFVIDLENAEALSDALEALKDLVPGMRGQMVTQDFAGQTIHTMQAPSSPGASARSVSYVITRSHFLLNIGRIGLLQEVLSSLESGANGFWQRGEIEALFEEIERPNAITRSYVDLETFVIPIIQSLVQGSQMGGEATALDMNRIPKNLSVPFHLISETNEAPDGLFTRTFIRLREDSK